MVVPGGEEWGRRGEVVWWRGGVVERGGEWWRGDEGIRRGWEGVRRGEKGRETRGCRLCFTTWMKHAKIPDTLRRILLSESSRGSRGGARPRTGSASGKPAESFGGKIAGQ